MLQLEVSNIRKVNSFSIAIHRIVIDEVKRIVMGAMEIVFESKKIGQKKISEAFVQPWKDNRIVYQRFYYKELLDAH